RAVVRGERSPCRPPRSRRRARSDRLARAPGRPPSFPENYSRTPPTCARRRRHCTIISAAAAEGALSLREKNEAPPRLATAASSGRPGRSTPLVLRHAVSPRPSWRPTDPPLSLRLFFHDRLARVACLGLEVLDPGLVARELLIALRHEIIHRGRVFGVLRGQDLFERRRRPIGQIPRP